MSDAYHLESEALTFAAVNSDSLNTFEKQVFLNICKKYCILAEVRTLITEGNLSSPSTSFLLSLKTTTGGGVF